MPKSMWFLHRFLLFHNFWARVFRQLHSQVMFLVQVFFWQSRQFFDIELISDAFSEARVNLQSRTFSASYSILYGLVLFLDAGYCQEACFEMHIEFNLRSWDRSLAGMQRIFEAGAHGLCDSVFSGRRTHMFDMPGFWQHGPLLVRFRMQPFLLTAGT